MKYLAPLIILSIWFLPGPISGGGVQEEQESLARAQKEALKPLETILSRYRRRSPVQIQLTKEVHQELLNRTQSSEGHLTLGSGRLRLELGAPDNSLLVHDGSLIWLAQEIDGFSGPITQVTKIRPDRLGPAATLLSALFERPDLGQDFELVEKSEIEGGEKAFSLRPRTQTDVVSLRLVLNPEKKLITQVSFKDDLNNETRYLFGRTQFSARVKRGHFEYKPPEGAEVTEY